MSARETTALVGGRWHGSYGVAPCPVCQPERRKTQNALTIADGAAGILTHCKKSGCDFHDILTGAGITRGNWTPPDAETIRLREAERLARMAKRSDQARRCWDETIPIVGTPAESYLRGRAITCDLPTTLRFHPECWHGPTSKRRPAMVALIEGAEGFGVHRTFLPTEAAPRDKMMLGATAGGSVRLSDGVGPVIVGEETALSGQRLAVCEGIETGLSLASGLIDGPAAVWAALSTAGLTGLRLPPQPGRLTICLDGDAPGRAAAHALAERAHSIGWQVSLADPGQGADWNDILTGAAA